MCTVPRPYPKELRDDVVAVARRGDAPIKQIAADFAHCRVVSAELAA
jgi:transposase-like protein